MTVTDTIEIATPEGFRFWLSVWSTGWCVLEPFSVDEDAQTLHRVHRLDTGKTLRFTARQEEKGRVAVHLESMDKLEEGEYREIEETLRSCLRIDEDFTAFYETLRDYPELSWAPEIGAGPSLRSPTVYEDLVKTIATTNASWGLTRGMVRRLCEKLGDAYADAPTFPTPEALNRVTQEYLRAEVKSGYRSPYLVEATRKIVAGELDVESWRGSPLDSSSLRKEIKAVKGIGDYAADNIMKLLGRYDFLALDSWMRRRFSELHGGGEPVPDEAIEEHYAPHGEWKGLVLALEVSKEWLVAGKRP